MKTQNFFLNLFLTLILLSTTLISCEKNEEIYDKELSNITKSTTENFTINYEEILELTNDLTSSMHKIFDINYEKEISEKELNDFLTKEYKAILLRNKITYSFLEKNNVKFIDEKELTNSIFESSNIKNEEINFFLNTREIYYYDKLQKHIQNDDTKSLIALLEEFKLELLDNKSSLVNLYFSFSLIESNKSLLESYNEPMIIARAVQSRKNDCLKAAVYGGVIGGVFGGVGGAVKGGIGGTFLGGPVGGGAGAIGGLIVGGISGFIGGAIQGYAGCKLFG